MADAYLGDVDRRSPTASPLFADLAGLPPLLCRSARASCCSTTRRGSPSGREAAGVDVTLELWDDVFHVWHAFADLLPEARDAIARIGAYVDQQLGDQLRSIMNDLLSAARSLRPLVEAEADATDRELTMTDPVDRGARRVGPQPPPGPEGARRAGSRRRHHARRARGARAPGRLHRLGLHGERQRHRDVLDVRSRRGSPDARRPARRRLRRPVRVAREGATSRRGLPGPRAVPVRQRDRSSDLGRRRRARAGRRRQPGASTTPGCPRCWPSSCRATASRSPATGT